MPAMMRAEAFRFLAIRDGRIPHPDAVVELTRQTKVEGHSRSRTRWAQGPRRGRETRLDSGLLIDITSVTVKSPLVGIVDAVVRHWTDVAPHTFISWDARTARYVEVTPAEVATPHAPIDARHRPSVVPWGATLLVLSAAADDARATCLRSIAQYSGTRCVAIGEGCAPVTAPELDVRGGGGLFSKYLSSLARFDSIIAVSDLAQDEYRGWKRMLAATGLDGPTVSVLRVPPATTSSPISPTLPVRDGIPLVAVLGDLTIGNNALPLLQAAESNWRFGLEFDLAITKEPTEAAVSGIVAYLRRHGRSIQIVKELADSASADLIRRAHFCIYLPGYDSFAAPIAHSLTRGIPVVTSNFGRMRELAEGVGGLVVEPRDPDSIGAAIHALLDDDARLGMRSEAAHGPASQSISEYARALLTLTLRESTETS